MKHVTEAEREVPVAGEFDVIVAGGGIAGTIAAIAASRMGARTAIIERFGRLGGNIGPGMWAGGSLHLALTPDSRDREDALINLMGMGGIPEEFVRRALSYRLDESQLAEAEVHRFNVAGKRLGSDYFVDSHASSFVAGRMMEENGVEVMLSTYVADPVLKGRRVMGVFVEGKSGRRAVLSRVVIDATGDADVARRAGLETNWSGGDPGIGLFYTMGDVDWRSFRESTRITERDRAWGREVLEGELGYPVGDIGGLLPHARRSWEQGGFRIVRRIDGFGRIVTRPLIMARHGIVKSRAETSGKIDPADSTQISILERRVREYIFELAGFLKSEVPGFGDSYLLVVGPYLGARGGRWVEAEYPISGDDVREGRRFDDVLYIYYDRRKQTATDIPYRALIPKGVDGLIAAGRSAVPRGPNFRARYSMMLMGQGAGIAAGICALEDIEPRELDHRRVQAKILDWGGTLVEDERLGELGLC